MIDFILATLPWRGFYRLKASDYLKLRQLELQESDILSLHDLLQSEDYDSFTQKKPQWIKQSLKEFEELKSSQISYTLLGDLDYPQELYKLKSPPLILTYQGKPCWQHAYRISVVGSRAPSPQTLSWMEQEYSQFLQKVDVATISGGAIGIDQKAHTISIKERRPTLCFLPSGLNEIYPRSLSNMKAFMLEHKTCFVSQFAPETKILPAHFHHRNQLIAALSKVNFVVEAKRRSGSLITAKAALNLNHSICTLPSHPMCEGSQGSLDLIQNGAHIIKDHQDLVSLIHLTQFNEQ